MTWDEFVAQHERLGELVAAFRADQERTGGGRTPCCHWGRHSDDLEQVVVAYCLNMEDSGYDCTDPDVLGGIIGDFVNDSDGRHAEYIIRDRYVLPDGFFDYLDTDRFTDEDEGLKVRLGIANRVATKTWDRLRRIVGDDRDSYDGVMVAPFQAAIDVMWSEIFDYWDEKEDA